MIVPSNTQNLILSVHLVDDGGVPVISQAYNTSGLVVSYRQESQDSYTALTLVDGTLGTYLASSWKEIGLGEYQLCLPNAAIAPGNETKLKIVVGGNAPLFDSVQARLPVGSGSGDRLITFTVSSGVQVVSGARITVMIGSLVVAGGATDASGNVSVYLKDGDYTVRVASSPVYEVLAVQDLTVDADASVPYSLVAIVIPEPTDPDMCVVRFYVQRCGSPYEGAYVTVKAIGDAMGNLTLDQVLIDRCEKCGYTNSSGYVDLELIQSSQFTRGGKYEILVKDSDRNVVHDRVVTVPDLPTAFAEELPDAS